MVRITFIANQTLTVFYYAVSQGLQVAGHQVFWITPSHRWGKWLIDQGVVSDRILDVTTYSEKWGNSQDINQESLDAIAELERCSGLTVNNLILMDRLLSKKPYKYALNYLGTIQKPIREFLVANQVEIVFAEHSWAIELLTCQICTKLKIPTFAPGVARIPDGRFVFFPGYLQAEVARVREVTDEDYQVAKAFYADYLRRKPQPKDYYIARKSLQFFTVDWQRIKNRIYYVWERFYLAKGYAFDETKPSLQELIFTGSTRVINTQTSIILKPFINSEYLKKRPFVLLLLHMQPEITIDVFGAYFSNQIELVKTLARSLPSTHYLYVKDHIAGLGSHSLIDYSRIKSIPGVYLIEPSEDTFKLIGEADLVISVSSTALYEAAILGKPAVSIVPMYFGSLLRINGMNPYVIPLSQVLDNIRDQENFKDEKENLGKKQIDFLAWLIAQSFPGEIGCPLSNHDCMLEDNIQKVTDGFLKFLASYESQLTESKDFLNANEKLLA